MKDEPYDYFKSHKKTENQGFTPCLEDTILKKQHGGREGVKLTPNRFRIK